MQGECLTVWNALPLRCGCNSYESGWNAPPLCVGVNLTRVGGVPMQALTGSELSWCVGCLQGWDL